MLHNRAVIFTHPESAEDSTEIYRASVAALPQVPESAGRLQNERPRRQSRRGSRQIALLCRRAEPRHPLDRLTWRHHGRNRRLDRPGRARPIAISSPCDAAPRAARSSRSHDFSGFA